MQGFQCQPLPVIFADQTVNYAFAKASGVIQTVKVIAWDPLESGKGNCCTDVVTYYIGYSNKTIN